MRILAATVAAISAMAAGHAATLSPAVVAQILQQIAIPTPWQTEQIDGGDGTWIVRVYAAPRQISPEVCLADGDEVAVDAGLKPVGKRSSYLFAIGSCADIAPDEFRNAIGALNQPVLVDAAAAVVSVLRTGIAPGITVTIADDEAKAALPFLKPSAMVFPELKAGGAEFGFVAPRHCGRIITFDFDEATKSLTVRYAGDLDFTDGQGNMVAPRCRD